MSETISSDVPAAFTLTLQPVSFSNAVTQSYALSLSPRSMYPGHAMISTSPSITGGAAGTAAGAGAAASGAGGGAVFGGSLVLPAVSETASATNNCGRLLSS